MKKIVSDLDMNFPQLGVKLKKDVPVEVEDAVATKLLKNSYIKESKAADKSAKKEEKPEGEKE